jgi:sodium transport system permease protein
MRWSIIRLIWARELRDQLRDRRTLFMIAVLPVLLYPIVGMGFMSFATGFVHQKSIIGVIGAQYLPAAQAPDVPPLFLDDATGLHVPDSYLDPDQTSDSFQVRAFDSPADTGPPLTFLDRVDRRPLDDKQVDVLLVVSPGFAERLAAREQPVLWVLSRPGDDHSRLVSARVIILLSRWKDALKQVRLAQQGLPPNFDQPFEISDPEKARPAGKQASEHLFELLVRVFPFVLVMWSLAGALYPAVDLCAGEKERGTMETLLISPASRDEIVWGKFLTIWVFSAATALLNLLSIGWTIWRYSSLVPAGAFQFGPLLWGVVLLLPLSAFFSALCLAVGAYARSSKEGQYYLMPLFLLTLPLIFLTLAPGVELNAFYSMVPVTGVALLLQRLMAAGVPGPDLWGYFPFVVAPMVLYGWLALRWAIEQFQREEVLFREAERLDLGLWLKRLLREKEALPSGGEAIFCFGLIIALQWSFMGLGGSNPNCNLPELLNLAAVRYLAFVAAPVLFMALLLTTRPLRGLALRWPSWWAIPAAVVLAIALLPPLALLTTVIVEQFPDLKRSLLEVGCASHDRVARLQERLHALRWQALLVLAVVPALCEEIAFRGLILSGLGRRFRPRAALLLSSFLFAVYQMNVIQFAPHFLLGVVMGMLTLRSRSVLPAIVFHVVWNMLVVGPVFYPEVLGPVGLIAGGSGPFAGRLLAAGVGLAVAVPLLALLWFGGWDRAGRQRPARLPAMDGPSASVASGTEQLV